ncbi:hypothetical protein MSMEI_6229 [Mycolicibacterium smegmatis MC2 155]|uniref:Uncharacterized protein n=2 Tax=Mycolicibacterium smegmatis (strain ATCC 700084 / mc(2)155) TaxID=246196 RepID=A0R622_MYCS2|nr:hypothetical protein MSMEG_6397 [Mycolicibacterium smegmatis MC2 155]AFP42655.1 hypothetical protein MSMEI_6229 [Mycolicibacterium smegmatis MC2 155]
MRPRPPDRVELTAAILSDRRSIISGTVSGTGDIGDVVHYNASSVSGGTFRRSGRKV